MAARLDQEAKRRAEKKPAAVENTALPDVTTFIDSEGRVWAVEDNGQIPTGRVVGRVVEGRVVELGKKKIRASRNSIVRSAIPCRCVGCRPVG